MRAKAITTSYQVRQDLKVCKQRFITSLGTPLTDLPPSVSPKPLNLPNQLKQIDYGLSNSRALHDVSPQTVNSPSTINFVRNRMFYARAALNTKGRVTFGLRHIRKSGRQAKFS